MQLVCDTQQTVGILGRLTAPDLQDRIPTQQCSWLAPQALMSFECLQALEDAITQQHEQERSIENEIHAYRKDIVREQIRNEQLTAVMRKLEGESGFLQTQNDTAVKKQEKLQV